MTTFNCPFCNHGLELNSTNSSEIVTSYMYSEIHATVNLKHIYCGNCKNLSVVAYGRSEPFNGMEFYLHPRSVHRHFPDYVPESIRQDYEEACSILELSPKAAATLCRRCLQTMIQNVFNTPKQTLAKDIAIIKSMVSPDVWNALDAIRQLGNIGAHMEYDVNLIIDIEIDEAKMLLRVLETLIHEWYVTKHNIDEDIKGIAHISAEKQNMRKNPTTHL